MFEINTVSNGVDVTVVKPYDDICIIYARLREDLWEVRNAVYTHKVDDFSDFNRHFTRDNINGFIDSLTATGKYTSIRVRFVNCN